MKGTLNLQELEINNNYSLSIRISSDGFSLSVLDQAGNVLVAREVPATLFQMRKEEIIELFETKMRVVLPDCSDVQLIVETNSYVFVPAPIFRTQDMDEYFYFQHPKDKTQIVLFNRIQNWDMVNVFSLPLELNKALNELFPDFAVAHHLSYFLSKKKITKEDGVYIWVRPKVMDAVVLKSGMLSLINSFAYQTAEDFTYFVLNIFDQLKLDTEKNAVKLYQRNNAKDFKGLISMYVNRCEIVH